jgi:hypothetical protein
MGETFRPFAKVWFEIIRNMFVVALFAYVASKSEYATLKLLSFLTTLVFIAYFISYIIEQLPVRSTAKNRYVRGAVELLISALVIFSFWRWTLIIMKILDEITKIQNH